MDAADAFTVIPRSLSTVNVSNSVISSLASFLAVVVVVVADELSFVVSADVEEEVVAFSLLFILPSLSLPTWYAFNCLSCPKFPVYSSTREAKLDLP